MEDAVSRYFGKRSGEVESVKMINWSRDGRPSGRSVVTFTDEESVENAIKLHRNKMGSRWLEVYRVNQGDREEVTCREACTVVDGCTYSSYCPPSDPACVLATDDMNEALISSNHVRRCILYAGCSSGTLRPANSNSGGDVVPYVTCSRDTHFRMVEAGCTDTRDPACATR